MLGELIYEEKGKVTGIRVLSSEGGETKVEVSIQVGKNRLVQKDLNAKAQSREDAK